MERNLFGNQNVKSKVAALLLKDIEAEHDFLLHKTNSIVKFEGTNTAKSISGASAKYLSYRVDFDGPNSKYSGTFMMTTNNEKLKGLVINQESSIRTAISNNSILTPQRWAGPSSMLSAIATDMKSRDIGNFTSAPELLKKGYDEEFKINFSKVADQAIQFEGQGNYEQRLNHQLAYYLEGLDRHYSNYDGSILTVLRNTELDVKAGDLIHRTIKAGLTIDPQNIAQINESLLRLSNTCLRFNDVTSTPEIKALNDAGIKASDFCAINYFSHRPIKANIDDQLSHLSRLMAAPLLKPNDNSTTSHKQSFNLHQQKVSECWKDIKNELKSFDYTNRSEVRSLSNKLNWLPSTELMEDLKIDGESFNDIIQKAKNDTKSSYKEMHRKDMSEARETYTSMRP
jgi:hypothetical protein